MLRYRLREFEKQFWRILYSKSCSFLWNQWVVEVVINKMYVYNPFLLKKKKLHFSFQRIFKNLCNKIYLIIRSTDKFRTCLFQIVLLHEAWNLKTLKKFYCDYIGLFLNEKNFFVILYDKSCIEFSVLRSWKIWRFSESNEFFKRIYCTRMYY